MAETLAQRVRAKHPGAYDDMSDQALEAAVIAKYPGVYDDIPRTAEAPKEPAGGTVFGRHLRPEIAAQLEGVETLGQPVFPMGSMATVAARAAAATGLGGRLLGAAKTAGSVAAPALKYEAVKGGLEWAGVPTPLATAAGVVASGMGGKPSVRRPSAPKAAAPKTAAPSAVPATPKVGGSREDALQAAGQSSRMLEDVQRLSGGSGARVVPGRGTMPGATSSSGAAAARPPAAPAPTAAPASQAVPSTPSAGLQSLSPAQIADRIGMAERRAKVYLTPQQHKQAFALVKQGTSPAEAVKAVASSAPKAPAAASAKPKMNVDEAKVYVRLRGQGKSHQDAVAAVEAQRALVQRLGTPTTDEVVRRVVDRNVSGRWQP